MQIAKSFYFFRCETTLTSDPFLWWPVSDNEGLLYKNIYCAICHGKKQHDVLYWVCAMISWHSYLILLLQENLLLT